ncbi:MAG: hypothetical protein ABI618_16150, partial [Nitrospirota bacterium]
MLPFISSATQVSAGVLRLAEGPPFTIPMMDFTTRTLCSSHMQKINAATTTTTSVLVHSEVITLFRLCSRARVQNFG